MKPIDNTNLIEHWESHLNNSLRAVEVARFMLERLYLENHPQLDLGKLATKQVTSVEVTVVD